MKICMDGLGVIQLQGTGLYTYTYELIGGLLELYPQSHYDILWDTSLPPEGWKKYKNITYSSLTMNRIENDYSLLEKHITDNNIRIYHSPNNGFSIPDNKNCKYVITVHDLVSITHEAYGDRKYADKFLSVFPDALQKSDKIIAVSDFIKDEMIRLFPEVRGKVTVIYPGCSGRFVPMEMKKCREVLSKRYKIDTRFLLHAGSIHTRKNLPLLLKAFKGILKEKKELKLVIAGRITLKREEYYLKLRKLVEQMNMEEQVIFTGMVAYSDMPYFYNGADCVINLSEYEGFPLSTVEAMACGTPVVCLDSSSFREAAGDGACFVKRDEGQIRDAVLEILSNDDYMKSLTEKAENQSRKYTSEIAIKKMVSLYESIAYGN